MSTESTTESSTLTGTVMDAMLEIYSLIPDSILFGSILLYVLTQNLAYGIFGVFIFETVLSHRFISWMFSQTVGSSRSLTADKIKCYSGFKTPQWNVARIFNQDRYPSYGIYSLSSIATYLLFAMNEFSSTLNAMGPDWGSRQYVSYALGGLLLLIFIFIRWYSDCDSLAEILIAMGFAFVTGAIFFYVNRQLFGIEGMNFLGLPYLIQKEGGVSSLYVCPVNNPAGGNP
jgi:hypothetical protein